MTTFPLLTRSRETRERMAPAESTKMSDQELALIVLQHGKRKTGLSPETPKGGEILR